MTTTNTDSTSQSAFQTALAALEASVKAVVDSEKVAESRLLLTTTKELKESKASEYWKTEEGRESYRRAWKSWADMDRLWHGTVPFSGPVFRCDVAIAAAGNDEGLKSQARTSYARAATVFDEVICPMQDLAVDLKKAVEGSGPGSDGEVSDDDQTAQSQGGSDN